MRVSCHITSVVPLFAQSSEDEHRIKRRLDEMQAREALDWTDGESRSSGLWKSSPPGEHTKAPWTPKSVLATKDSGNLDARVHFASGLLRSRDEDHWVENAGEAEKPAA